MERPWNPGIISAMTEMRGFYMQDLGNTQYFKVETEPETGVKVVLADYEGGA